MHRRAQDISIPPVEGDLIAVRLADKQFKIVVQFFFTLPKAEYLRNIKGKIHTGLLIVGHGVPGPGQSKKNLISGSSYTKKLRERCWSHLLIKLSGHYLKKR